MNEVVIKPKTIVRFSIDGKSYDTRKPNLARASQLEYDIESLGPKASKEKMEVMIKFLEELGLPREVTLDLEPEQFDQIIEALTPRKKP